MLKPIGFSHFQNQKKRINLKTLFVDNEKYIKEISVNIAYAI